MITDQARQTSAAQVQILLGPEGQGLFDFSLLALRPWPEPFPERFDRLDGEFERPSGIGRTIFVNTESELVLSDAEQFRSAAENPPPHDVGSIVSAAASSNVNRRRACPAQWIFSGSRNLSMQHQRFVRAVRIARSHRSHDATKGRNAT